MTKSEAHVPIALPPPGEDAAALQALIGQVLEQARRRGASSAEASAGTASGLDVNVRLGEVDTLEHQRDKQLAITAYLDGRKGSATTSEFSPAALEETVAAALAIARHASEDPYAGLVDPRHLASRVPDLDLDHPWDLDPDRAVALARDCEAVALEQDPRIRNSEGASVASTRGTQAYGNSHGFSGAWSATRHSISCTVVAQDAGGMQRDYWYSVARDPGALDSAHAVGLTAAERALRRLGARSMPTTEVPVLFEARAATTLFGHFISAVSGGSLYRRASFLLDCLGRQVFAPGVHIEEQPHLPRALGSAPFDGDGVATRSRSLVDGGVLQGYVLSAYSARKLGMEPTGNAGGVHNLVVRPGELDLPGLLKLMGRGLLITDLMGFGVNGVTGDYSRGASGFWVENGSIQYPVEEITVAGNLKRMFMDIQAVGREVDTRHNIRTGPVLIGRMTVAGQ